MKYEIAIKAYDDPGPTQSKAGDIICVRKALGTVGSGEMHRWIWITVDVADPAIIPGLDEPEEGDTKKRRFKIPLARLKALNASMNMARVNDPLTIEQPFMNVTDTRRMISKGDVPITGLIFDKQVGS